MLLYRIVDAMTESFYPLLGDFDERIDDLEDRTFASPDDSVLQEIFQLKRRLVGVRKVVTAQRDLFGSVSAGSEDLPGVTAEDERVLPRRLRPPDPDQRPARHATATCSRARWTSTCRASPTG